MKEHSHDLKSMVILQNSLGLVKGEPGSCNVPPAADETVEVSTKAEEAIDIKEESNSEAITLPVMETEHAVSLHVHVCVFDGGHFFIEHILPHKEKF
jgi:hypothetical protein